MNIELTIEGVKTIFNWDNVLTVGHEPPSSSSYEWNKKIRVWMRDNITFSVDETYEEMKDIIK